MSFDSTFDYSNVLAFIQTCSNDCNDVISHCDSRIQVLDDLMVANINIDIPYLQDLQQRKDAIYYDLKPNHMRLGNNWQSLENEVNTVVNLDSSDKANIYNFFKNSIDMNQVPVNELMGKLVYNTNSFINDVNVINDHVSNGNITSDQSNVISVFVFNNYNIDANVRAIFDVFPNYSS